MIVCPNCRHNNMNGAMFCSECGAHLVSPDNLVTQNIAPDQKDMEEDLSGRPVVGVHRVAGSKLDTWGTLHLLETGQMLPLSDRSEFTLGRISDGQPIMPDIDLSPYHAYANGVSRLHAVVKRKDEQILLMDLGSSNGTYLNGKRIPPNVEQILRHGDVAMFGKLKIQILLKSI
jgi:transcription initiation factor TFIIIB Brf1 subunit/transcription initiation factor TFIIB